MRKLLLLTFISFLPIKVKATSYLVGSSGQAIILGSSGDTKPDSQDGIVFIEEDTGKILRRVNSVWTELLNPSYLPAISSTTFLTTSSAAATYVNKLNQTGPIFTSSKTYIYSNSAIESTMTATNGIGTLTIPANFWTPGKTLYFHAVGISSNTLTPTLRVRLKVGTTTFLDSTARTMASGILGAHITIDGYLTCYTTGTAGAFIANGNMLINVANLPVNTVEWFPANSTTTNLNTTVPSDINLTFLHSAASPLNIIRITSYVVEFY